MVDGEGWVGPQAGPICCLYPANSQRFKNLTRPFLPFLPRLPRRNLGKIKGTKKGMLECGVGGGSGKIESFFCQKEVYWRL